MPRRLNRPMLVLLVVSSLTLASACVSTASLGTAADLETRTVRAGTVDITIQPIRLDEAGAIFRLTFDTHAEELTLDVAAGSRLEVGGTMWASRAWTGDPPGGHHRSGELRFDPAGPPSGRVALEVDGLSEPVTAEWLLPPQ